MKTDRLSGPLEAWLVQVSWSETRKTDRGELWACPYATAAEIVEGRRDWAVDRAQSMIAELLAANPVAGDVTAHIERLEVWHDTAQNIAKVVHVLGHGYTVGGPSPDSLPPVDDLASLRAHLGGFLAGKELTS